MTVADSADQDDRPPQSDSELSHSQFRALANAMPNMAWIANPDGWLTWYNQRWYDYTGTTPEEMAGWGWQSVHHPDVLPEMLERWTTALATGEPFEMTFPLRRGSDGSFRIFMTRAEPLRENGAIVGWYGTNTDVTEQERTRERLQLVINELNHRVKNTLATVHSLAISTFRQSDPAAMEAFEHRLLALARVHDLLTRGSWQAAHLEDVVRTSIAGFDGERFVLHGPEVEVPARVASVLAMTLHELGTNAIKYGSLSADGGTVEIDWSTEPTGRGYAVKIDWRERGGPEPVPGPEGFGMRLIKRATASEAGSRVEHSFGPEGATCSIVIPIAVAEKVR